MIGALINASLSETAQVQPRELYKFNLIIRRLDDFRCRLFQ